MKVNVSGTQLCLVKGDITLEETDAIVNAANSSLLGGGGVDGAIHAAGGPRILEEGRAIREKTDRLPAGQAVATTGGDLKAGRVIHTVGPVWKGGGSGEADTLASCYVSCLALAAGEELKTISFPSISTGAYGYPVEEAARVALQAVIRFLGGGSRGIDQVRFVLFSRGDLENYSTALGEIFP